jgi:hypothetical protein
MDTDLRTIRENHLHATLGGNYVVLVEQRSDDIQLDVYVYDADADRPWLTLVTSGMSDLPMTVPAGLERFARAELVFNLPAPWPGLGVVDEGALPAELADETNYWPVRLIKELARRPHALGDRLGMGQVIASDVSGEPFPGTGFTGVMIGPVQSAPGLARLETDAGPILYYALYPLLPDEMAVATGTNGSRTLFGRFDERGVGDVFDPDRPSALRQD